ncbi:hypothetical protein GCM10025867_40420 [Frondihabitans sucicola]|uniref:Photolyase/cryptochrome alpha/beta domain-containing protein n=1 Tax=Frondihabitans sucicola TaxID=1268041 RepID=A0ABN6Y3Z0_9MICO|nr:hypothetical protein GCM10025867_40420 [Frondihabitans sucicola]
MVSRTLVWLRDDLRVADNPALHHAIQRGGEVVVAYVLDDETTAIRPLGGASRWWLHQSLAALSAELERRGARLTLRRGAAADVIPSLVDESGADAVFWNRRYGKAARDADAALKSSLRDRELDVSSFQGSLLFEPWTVQTGQGTPFKVFTPFYRACLEQPEPRHPFPAPSDIPSPATALPSDDLDSWALEPSRPDWAGGLRDRWEPGEKGRTAPSRRSSATISPTTPTATSRPTTRRATSPRSSASARSAPSRSGTACAATSRRTRRGRWGLSSAR